MQTNGNRSSLVAEHEKLGKTIAAMRTLVSDESFSWDSARVSLTELRETLESHFSMEEAGGYLASVTSEAPQHSLLVAKLESDHSRMRGMLASLLAGALVARSREDLRNDVEEFLAFLASHERRENQLVIDTFTTDIPATD
jgi:hemerythrin